MNEKFGDEALEKLSAQNVQDAKKFADEAVPKVKALMLEMAALGYPTMIASCIPATRKDGVVGYHHAVAYTPEFVNASQATMIAVGILTGTLQIPPDIMEMLYLISLKTADLGKKQVGPGCGGRSCTQEQMDACDKSINVLAQRVRANEPGLFESAEDFTSPCGDVATVGKAAAAMRDTLKVEALETLARGRSGAPTPQASKIDQMFANAEAPAKPVEAAPVVSPEDAEEQAVVASLDGEEPNDGLAHQFLYNTPKTSGKFN